METAENYHPNARHADLIVEELDGEVVVYDLRSHRVSCLNPTAALIWKQSDGTRSVGDLARELEQATGLPADPEVVILGLNRLSALNLLENGERFPWVTRRQVIQRLALKVALTALLPVITTVRAEAKDAISSCVSRTFCALPQYACSPCYQGAQPNENQCESRRCYQGSCRPQGQTPCP